ncbi:MAG: Protein TolB [Phycisphaerales bacterium]|nr:Protein TolB [Phycisphaerales bacterium]
MLATVGTAALLTPVGCGWTSSGTQTPATTTAAAPSTTDEQAAGGDTSVAQASPELIVGGASPGTGAWINPQARQEPGEDNAPATFNLQQVTFAEEGSDFDPAISRDGSRIVFASTQHRPTADLYVKSISGRTITQLTSDPSEDGTPDISPDGSKVAFASNRGGSWDIYVMPISGGKAVAVTQDASDELHPSWSPDGTQLVFCRMGPTSGRWEMWVTDATKAGSATFIGYGLFPRWCPSSGTGENGADRIVYQVGRERGQRSFAIWTVDYHDGQASNPTLIASSSSAALINPTWSPDGRFIAYASVPASETSGQRPSAELWLASVMGDATVRLTSGDLRAIRPAWGPANRLYFVSDRNSTENIWSIDLAQSLASAGGTPAATTAAAKPNSTLVPGSRQSSSAEEPAETTADASEEDSGD